MAKRIVKKVLVVVISLVIMVAAVTVIVGFDEQRFPDWLVDITNDLVEFVEDASFLGILFFLHVVPGIILSLFVLIPLIRRRAQNDFLVRKVTIVVIGILSLLLTFPATTRLKVEIMYIFTDIFPSPITTTQRMNLSAIIRELWVRTMIPPLVRQPCYATQFICRLTDQLGFNYLMSWKSFMTSVAHTVISSMVGSALAWCFSRQGGSKQKLEVTKV